jgi:RNA polymerase sigma factor (sigma-70 family)
LYSVRKWDKSKNVPFRSFAFLRIRGAIVDAVRAVSSTSRWRNVTYVQLEDVYTAPEDDDSEAIGVSKATSLQLREGLKKLPLRQAMVLLLGINGLPVRSIAGLLEVSQSQVQKDRQRGLLSLQDRLMDSLSD